MAGHDALHRPDIPAHRGEEGLGLEQPPRDLLGLLAQTRHLHGEHVLHRAAGGAAALELRLDLREAEPPTTQLPHEKELREVVPVVGAPAPGGVGGVEDGHAAAAPVAGPLDVAATEAEQPLDLRDPPSSPHRALVHANASQVPAKLFNP